MTNYMDKKIPEGWQELRPGLSKREYFAAMALQGLLSDPKRSKDIEYNCTVPLQYADALIEALNKKENE